MTQEPRARPAWVGQSDRRRSFDARPLLGAGRDPFAAIMGEVAGLAPGEMLVIDAPFDPVPLRRVLGRKGFADHAEALGPAHWRAYFRQVDDPATDAAVPAAQADAASIWQEEGSVHIDVRGLDPPEPMLAILRMIESEDCPPTVIVHHDREPIYLYPELTERAWRFERIAAPAGEVRLRLSRDVP